jgi:hypothetical protein
VLGNVQRETRLPHAWSAGDDDQVPVLKSRRHLVEICVPGGLAGNAVGIAMQLVQAAHHPSQHGRHLGEALRRAAALLADFEDARLGFVQELARLPALRRIRRIRDVRADLGQLAHDGPLANDFRVAAHVRRAGRAGSELVQVRETSGVVGLP